MLQSEPGTYLLVCPADRPRNIRIGAKGLTSFDKGYYLYVGSAFGPGGIRARVGRHCRRRKPKRWHIDYLTAHFRPTRALISYEQIRHEHDWASQLEKQQGMLPMGGFGNSDCRCRSHLFLSRKAPDQAALVSGLAGDIEVVAF